MKLFYTTIIIIILTTSLATTSIRVPSDYQFTAVSYDICNVADYITSPPKMKQLVSIGSIRKKRTVINHEEKNFTF